MTNQTAFRRWLFALALCAIAVVLCAVYLDRPIALFFEARFRHTDLWVWLNHALAPLDLVVIIALFFLLACGIWAASGRRLGGWAETPVLCAWSAMWAVVSDVVFKRVFGRAWPDPTYIQDHLYGFHLLHGGAGWNSFPSGTAAISASIVSVLWIVSPRWRIIAALTVVVLSGAVVAGNYHWLSDVIAGAFLGASIGWFTTRLRYPVNPRHGRYIPADGE